MELLLGVLAGACAFGAGLYCGLRLETKTKTTPTSPPTPPKRKPPEPYIPHKAKGQGQTQDGEP